MSNAWRIFLDDVRSATGSIVAILVVLGLCLAPALLAWFGIAGNWNPLENARSLTIAVANSDAGHESDLMPVRVNIGDRVVDSLHDDDRYGWVFVTEKQAVEGVRAGEYYAAVVIPEDFSEKMMTLLSADAEKATIGYYLNLKENPTASAAAGAGDTELLEGVREKLSAAIDAIAADLASDFASFIDSGKTENFGARLVARLDEVADGLDAASAQVRAYVSIIDASSSLTSSSSNVLSQADDAATTSEEFIEGVADELDSAVAQATGAASRIRDQVASAKGASGLDGVGTQDADKLAGDVSKLASSVASIERNADALAKSLDEAVKELAGETDSLTSDLNFERSMLGTAANRLGASASKVRKFRDDASKAVASGNLAQLAGVIGNNPDSLAHWLAAPVEFEKRDAHPFESYGSSAAPFITVLSLWVGAIALVAVMNTTVSESRVRCYEDESGRPVRGYERYLGRFAIFAVFSLLQATLVCLGELFFLQVQCAHPLLLFVACWVCALVFCSVAYTLVSLLGKAGLALGAVLLVVQVAGSDAGCPQPLAGGFIGAVQQALPFAHGAHAMQASIAGVYGTDYLVSLACTLAFLALSLFLGLAVRRPIVRITRLFSAKLQEADLL